MVVNLFPGCLYYIQKSLSPDLFTECTTLACLWRICRTEGLRLWSGFRPWAGGPRTPAWPRTPESLQEEVEGHLPFPYQFLPHTKNTNIKNNIFVTLICKCSCTPSYCKSVQVYVCSGQEQYLVAVVGSPGWEMLPGELLLLLPGSRPTKPRPTEGSLESSLCCNSTHTHILWMTWHLLLSTFINASPLRYE